MATKPRVSGQTETEDSLEEKGSMPALGDVGRVIQYEETLDEKTADEACGCHKGLPGDDTQPTSKIAEELSAPCRR